MKKATDKMLRGAEFKVMRLKSAMPSCKSVLGVGPGHQSKARCERKGKHLQHWDSNMEFYWTKQEFSGYFDDSPEEQMSDEAIRAFSPKKKKRKK